MDQLEKLHGKELYQVDLRIEGSGKYLEPVYLSASNDEEAFEKAIKLEANGFFRVKFVSKNWIDEEELNAE